jgi:hypothetical protein
LSDSCAIAVIMESDLKRTHNRRRRRDTGEETTPNSAAATAAFDSHEVEQRRLQMELLHKKDRIHKVCASPAEWTTRELRETAKRLNLPNTSKMSKKGLCALLVKHHDMQVTEEVEDETPEYPPGCFDIISHGPMYDPIIASDGYSYNRSSLRKMLVTAHREGKPCVSLINKSITLENPFPDIPGMPKTWPLIANKSLKQWVEHWMQEHGLEVTDEERKEHERIPTPSRVDSLTPDEHGGIMQNGIYFIPSPDDVGVGSHPVSAADADNNENGGDSTDEEIELLNRPISTSWEDSIQRVVDAVRDEAPTMTYTKYSPTENSLLRLAFEGIEESAEMCLRRILNAYGCVVVNTLADKDVLLRHWLPIPVVVLDTHQHRIFVFNQLDVNQLNIPPNSTKIPSSIHDLVHAILECVWARSMHMYDSMLAHLTRQSNEEDWTTAAWIRESDIGVWEGEQHFALQFVPERLNADISSAVAECRANGISSASYSSAGSTLLARQQIRRPDETTEACLQRLLLAYGCVTIKDVAAYRMFSRSRITVPVVAINPVSHLIRVIDANNNVHTIRGGTGGVRVDIGILLIEILSMVWAPSHRQHVPAYILRDVFAHICSDLTSETVKMERSRYNNSEVCTTIMQSEIGMC